MPAVAERIEQVTGKKPFQGISPHTSVAQGAAIHAAVLDAKYRGDKSKVAESVRKHLEAVRQDEVNSHGLGVVARHPRSGKYINHVMIPHNSRLPIEVSQTFHTNEPNQQRVSIKVTEGDAPDPAACTTIGTCRITDLPADLPAGAPIEVTYSFDSAGRVRVRAKDKTGGQEASIEIERRGGLNDAQIDDFMRLASEYKVE
jgi:molecular chaperone DnaK